MEKEGHATEMCQYVRCGCRDFIKNFMTLLWSLPSPGNPRASAALEVGNARGYAEYRPGWFKRLLPCCAGCFSALFAAPLLPAPTSQGRGSWGAHSGESSGSDPAACLQTKRTVLQTWAGIVKPWLAQQEGSWLMTRGASFPGSWLCCLPLGVPATLQRQCPVRRICIVSALGDLWWGWGPRWKTGAKTWAGW